MNSLAWLVGAGRWSTHLAAAPPLAALNATIFLAAALDRRFSTSTASATSTASSDSGGDGAGGSSTTPPPTVPVQRLQHAITPQVCDHLRRRGFAVIDGVFGPETAAALRAEVAAVRGAMHKNHTHLVHGGSTGLLEKEHIWEAELMQKETQELAPLCAQLQHDGTLRVMLSLLMPELRLHSQAIKLQYNAGGGGSFPMHFDTDEQVDERRVTAIWYLNPGWRPGDGGELRLYPFPEPAVDVQPLNDRMVLFSSAHMLHRVLPAAAERYCFTIWLSGGGGQRRAGTAGQAGAAAAAAREELRRALSGSEPLAPAAAWRLLTHPQLRKHAAKWLHREEWERSVRESHAAGAGLQQALDVFAAEAGVVHRALAPLLPALVAGPPPAGVPPPAWF